VKCVMIRISGEGIEVVDERLDSFTEDKGMGGVKIA